MIIFGNEIDYILRKVADDLLYNKKTSMGKIADDNL